MQYEILGLGTARNNAARELIEFVFKKLNKVLASESIQGQFEDTRSLLQIAEGRILSSVILPCKIVCTFNKTEIDKLISGTYCLHLHTEHRIPSSLSDNVKFESHVYFPMPVPHCADCSCLDTI